MLKRQTEGSVVCTSCGKLVAVQDKECWNCGRRNPGLWGYAPLLRGLGSDLGFTKVLLGACFAVFAMMLLAFQGQGGGRGLMGILAPSDAAVDLFGAAGYLPVIDRGRWLNLLSAGMLHGGLLHIGFNMFCLYQLGPMAAHLYGAGRTMIVYVLSSVAGFALTSIVAGLVLNGLGLGAFRTLSRIGIAGAPVTLGASAAIFGLVGALVYASRRTGSSLLGAQLAGFVLPLFIIGFLIPNVDNWAHIGGFAAGYLIGRRLDPAKPERADHLLIGLLLFAAMLLSVVVSVVSRYSLYFG